MRPLLHHVAAEAALRIGLSSACRWCVIFYAAEARRPRLRPEVLGQVSRELHARRLVDPATRRFDVRRLLEAAGLSWQPERTVAR